MGRLEKFLDWFIKIERRWFPRRVKAWEDKMIDIASQIRPERMTFVQIKATLGLFGGNSSDWATKKIIKTMVLRGELIRHIDSETGEEYWSFDETHWENIKRQADESINK